MTNLPEGMTLMEALDFFSDPDVWGEYKKLLDEGVRPDGPGVWVVGSPETEWMRKQDRCSQLHEVLLTALKGKLERGEVIATALDIKRPIDAMRARVPAETWHFLEINFEKSTAAGEGLLLTGLRFMASSEVDAATSASTTSTGSTIRASTECRKWMKDLRSSKAGPFKKDELWDRAKERFGNSLSRREFERIWKTCASMKWKRPGRKSKRRIDTPN